MPIFRLADHRRRISTLIAASFLAATVTVGGPAFAQTDEPSPSTGSARSESEHPAPDSSTPRLAAAAAGLLTGRLLYTTASNLTPRPMNSGVVTAYRLTGSQFEFHGETVIFDPNGDWSISGLPAGEYRSVIAKRARSPTRAVGMSTTGPCARPTLLRCSTAYH